MPQKTEGIGYYVRETERIGYNVRALSAIVSYDISRHQPGIGVTVREKSIKIFISEMEFWKHLGNILHDCTLPWIENYQLYVYVQVVGFHSKGSIKAWVSSNKTEDIPFKNVEMNIRSTFNFPYVSLN